VKNSQTIGVKSYHYNFAETTRACFHWNQARATTGPPKGVGKLPEVSHNTATLNEITYVRPIARGGAGGQVHPLSSKKGLQYICVYVYGCK